MFLRSILNNNKTAQALAELTLFGSFFIMLLAVTVSYSMRYNSQQRVSQEAFRKGIVQLSDYAATDSPVSTPSITYLRYRDDYVPDPANPFGLGSVESSVSSATLTRDYRMHMSAGEDYELPQVAVDIDGITSCDSHLNEKYRDSQDADLRSKYGSEDSPCYYLAAGFRVDDGVSRDEDTFDRYAQVYGEGSLVGCNDYNRTDNSCSEWMPIYEWDDDEWKVNGNLSNPFSLRMIDNSGGEIMEYGSTVSQCRRIVDDADQHSDVKDTVCYQECDEAKSAGSKTDCSKICEQDVITPWYCGEYEEINDENHLYKFPVLNGLFGISASHKYTEEGSPKPVRTMGVQANYDLQSEKDGTASYSNEEDLAGAQNRVDLSSGWTDTIKRRAIFLPYQPNRDSGDEDDLETGSIDNQKSPDISSFTWETAR